MLCLPEEWVQQGVEGLEARAWDALRETVKSVSVTAGAGAGKTEFLAQKATYLLQTGTCPRPRRILAISFKRDAAENLADRVRRRCPSDGRRFVSLTFDAFSKSLMDQFRAALPVLYQPPFDYHIAYSGRDAFEEFLARHDSRDVHWKTFEGALATTQLPYVSANIPTRRRELLGAYWDEQLRQRDQSLLTFAMINRLAEWLLRSNKHVRRALRSTYPFVFLDEFQDTTTAQFQIVTAAFDKSTSVLTAVGDDKQKIMVWAGAMPDAFATFQTTFDAREISLLSNWRSHSDLVAIQHLIARQLDPLVEEAEAKRARQIDGDIAAIWQFSTQEEEIDFIPMWIAGELARGVTEANKITILVRNGADAVEQQLGPAFQHNGVAIRNLARNVGGVAIQDLLAEEFTEIILPLLRLGARRRDAESWALALAQLQWLEGIEEGDEQGNQCLVRKLESCSAELRAYMRQHLPCHTSPATILSIAFDAIGEQQIRQAIPSYGREADFRRVRSGFDALLQECCSMSDTWTESLDRFEGKGQVSLMTVHKSKGLEFHTMIFFGLDDKTWWSLKPNNKEELSSFFVAFTRAEQRAFFTCCDERGGRIRWLENILGDAVPRVAPAAS